MPIKLAPIAIVATAERSNTMYNPGTKKSARIMRGSGVSGIGTSLDLL